MADSVRARPGRQERITERRRPSFVPFRTGPSVGSVRPGHERIWTEERDDPDKWGQLVSKRIKADRRAPTVCDSGIGRRCAPPTDS